MDNATRHTLDSRIKINCYLGVNVFQPTGRNADSAITYSFSCRSKPAWLSFYIYIFQNIFFCDPYKKDLKNGRWWSEAVAANVRWQHHKFIRWWGWSQCRSESQVLPKIPVVIHIFPGSDPHGWTQEVEAARWITWDLTRIQRSKRRIACH